MNSGSEGEGGDDSLVAGLPQEANITSKNDLSAKSKKSYESAYRSFMDWKTRNNYDSFSEKVFLAYFNHLSKIYRASSLVPYFSMLRNTMNVRHNVDMDKYKNVYAFIKSNIRGYKCRGSKIFNTSQINKFLNEAPDEKYLTAKVILIMGLVGSCHTTELYAMSINDLEDIGAAYLVRIPNNKSKVVRKFVVTDRFYNICKKYVSLRPSSVTTDALFLNYNNGRCSTQRMGINRFGFMGKQIALFLKLSNPELYNGRCFRKSKGMPFDANEVTLPDGTNWSKLHKSNSLTEMECSNALSSDSAKNYRENENSFCESELISNDTINSASDPLDGETPLSESEYNYPNDFFNNDENESKETDSEVEYKFDPDLQNNDPMLEETVDSQNDTMEGNNAAMRPEIVSSNKPEQNISDLDNKIKLKQLQLIEDELEQNKRLFEARLEKYQLEKEMCSVQLQKFRIELQLKQKEFEDRMKNS